MEIKQFNGKDYVLTDTFTTEHSEVVVYTRHCSTKEESDELRKQRYMKMAKVAADHWKKTGVLL